MPSTEFRKQLAELTSQLVGPHHSHPEGEIDLIMPLDERCPI